MHQSVRLAAAGLVAAALGGCTSANVGNVSVFGGDLAKPQVVLVSDFEIPADAVRLDSGFAARLKRNMKGASDQALRAEVARRVSTTVAETVVARLREAGLEALPGNRALAIEGQATLVVGGHVRRVDEGNRTRRNAIGFGAGKSSVAVDVQVAHLAGGESKNVLAFTAEAESAPRPGAVATAPVGAAVGIAASAASTAGGLASEKLSADVEAQARRIGSTIAERVIAFAVEHGWARKPAA
jgi:hypothetical protein